jgi:hypothetical protein
VEKLGKSQLEEARIETGLSCDASRGLRHKSEAGNVTLCILCVFAFKSIDFERTR